MGWVFVIAGLFFLFLCCFIVSYCVVLFAWAFGFLVLVCGRGRFVALVGDTGCVCLSAPSWV